MKNLIKYLLIALLFLLASCTTSNEIQDSKNQELKLTQTEKQLFAKTTDFGINLFQKAAYNQTLKNTMISPLSVSMALSMTLNGADKNTLTQMQNILGFESLSVEEINKINQSLIDKLTKADKSVVFNVANSIWYKNSFPVKDKFIKDNKTYYNAEVNALDFANPTSLSTINSWVNNKTNGKIEKIIEEIDPMAVMFLINALYFNADWKYKFDAAKTITSNFYDDNGNVITSDAKLMKLTANLKGYADENIISAELPYGDSLFSMKIIKPNQNKKINDIIGLLDRSYINKINEESKTSEIDIKLPRFKFANEMELQEILSAMGMEDAFTGSANFSKIADWDLFISKVLHKTYIDVNEKGTEAAAVTSVEIRYTSVGIDYTYNQPFIFIISAYGTDNIMFIGTVVNPTLDK